MSSSCHILNKKRRKNSKLRMVQSMYFVQQKGSERTKRKEQLKR